MALSRLNQLQGEILKIYQETSKRRKTPGVALTRQDISKLIFRRREMARPGTSRQTKEEKKLGKTLEDRKIPYELETKEQTFERIFGEKQKEDLKKDWRQRSWSERVGLMSVYNPKQTDLTRSLNHLVRKGYLQSKGSELGKKYLSTEKTFGIKLPHLRLPKIG